MCRREKEVSKAGANLITICPIFNMVFNFSESINRILEISHDSNQFLIGQFGNAVAFQELLMKVMVLIRQFQFVYTIFANLVLFCFGPIVQLFFENICEGIKLLAICINKQEIDITSCTWCTWVQTDMTRECCKPVDFHAYHLAWQRNIKNLLHFLTYHLAGQGNLVAADTVKTHLFTLSSVLTHESSLLQWFHYPWKMILTETESMIREYSTDLLFLSFHLVGWIGVKQWQDYNISYHVCNIVQYVHIKVTYRMLSPSQFLFQSCLQWLNGNFQHSQCPAWLASVKCNKNVLFWAT